MNTFNNPNGLNNNFLKNNQFSSPYYNSYNSTLANTSTNNIVWVQGIEGAKAWQLNPNSMVILLDSEIEGKMYIKTSDNIGMSNLRIFNYTEEINNSNISNNVGIGTDLDLSEYVKKEELTNLIKEIMNEYSISTTSGSTAATTDESKPKISIIKK